MIEMVERIYNVPLRKAFQKAPRYKRAKRAINTIKIFLKKHMKSEDIKLGKHLNLKVWEHGIKNPPHHVKINVTKDDKDVVKAELVGFTYEEKLEEKKETKKGKKEDKKEVKQGEKEIKGELNKLEGKTKELKEGVHKEGKKAMKKKLEKELKEKK